MVRLASMRQIPRQAGWVIMLSPDVVLPLLQCAAIVSVSGAIIGGIIAGYFDYRRGIAKSAKRFGGAE